MQPVAIKTGDLVKAMKKNMIKNRSITQPKLLTSETTTPRKADPAKNRTSASPVLRPEVNGILPQTIIRHKVNKSQFMSINPLPQNMEYPEKSPTHVIPTAVLEKNDESNKKSVKAPNVNNVFHSRSKSTLLTSSLLNMGKTGPSKFKKNSINSDIPEDPFKSVQNSGRINEIYSSMDKLVDRE